MDALKLVNVTKSYYPSRKTVTPVVDSVSLTVKSGSVYGFLGPNGAGKTTIMKMIVGLAHPTSGSITIFGQKADTLPAHRSLGYMPENPVFYRYLTAYEFLVMHARLAGLTGREAKRETDSLLELVGLAKARKKRIREFSKGMVQRVGLAQALVGKPNILLLDEPFDGLDVLGRYEMKRLILDLRKEHKTIFFNSHILSDVEEICDSIAIIDHGQLLEQKPIAGLLKKGQTLEHYFVEKITAHNRQKES